MGSKVKKMDEKSTVISLKLLDSMMRWQINRMDKSREKSSYEVSRLRLKRCFFPSDLQPPPHFSFSFLSSSCFIWNLHQWKTYQNWFTPREYLTTIIRQPIVWNVVFTICKLRLFKSCLLQRFCTSGDFIYECFHHTNWALWQ